MQTHVPVRQQSHQELNFHQSCASKVICTELSNSAVAAWQQHQAKFNRRFHSSTPTPEGRPEHVISQQPKILYVGNGPSTAILGTV